MDSDEETARLLPGRDSVTDEHEVEDIRAVCTRVAYAVTILTALLVGTSTTMYFIYFQPEAPVVNLQDIKFNEFQISPMIDRSGVPTQGLLAEAAIKVAFFNPSILYDTKVKQVHGLISFKRTIAYGKGEDFMQLRNSGRVINLEVTSVSDRGRLEPLYGAAPVLLHQISQRGIVDLLVEFQLKSEFSMFHGLVSKEYTMKIRCDVDLMPGESTNIPGHSGGVIVNHLCSSVQ